jgi:hypothetical protein
MADVTDAAIRRYLLGLMPESEAEVVEPAYLALASVRERVVTPPSPHKTPRFRLAAGTIRSESRPAHEECAGGRERVARPTLFGAGMVDGLLERAG